jgi:hypothetical protein
VGAEPTVPPIELAVLVKALLTGLALQKRLDPATVPDDLALRGIGALVGLQFSALEVPTNDTIARTASV